MLDVTILNFVQGNQYRIALRSQSNDWDSVYLTSEKYNQLYPEEKDVHYISVAGVDENGVEGLFGEEVKIFKTRLGIDDLQEEKAAGISLLQNKPNPFDETTFISVLADEKFTNKQASIQIVDLNGKLIQRFDFLLEQGMNDIEYLHGYANSGVFIYSLTVDGQLIDSKQMVFAN